MDPLDIDKAVKDGAAAANSLLDRLLSAIGKALVAAGQALLGEVLPK